MSTRKLQNATRKISDEVREHLPLEIPLAPWPLSPVELVPVREEFDRQFPCEVTTRLGGRSGTVPTDLGEGRDVGDLEGIVEFAADPESIDQIHRYRYPNENGRWEFIGDREEVPDLEDDELPTPGDLSEMDVAGEWETLDEALREAFREGSS